MTERKGKAGTIDVKALLAGDEEFLRALMRTALQEVLEVEMSEALGAEKGERTAGRLGHRSGYYGRTLITRVGKLELRCRKIAPGGSRHTAVPHRDHGAVERKGHPQGVADIKSESVADFMPESVADVLRNQQPLAP